MARKATVPMTKLTQGEFNQLLAQRDQQEERVRNLQADLKTVAADGTDDENPMYAQVRQSLTHATNELGRINTQLDHCIIITPKQNENGEINQSIKAVTLRCIYPGKEPSDRRFVIGHELGNLTPASPLFNFIIGKTVGFSDTFTHKTNLGITTYHVEILDIEF